MTKVQTIKGSETGQMTNTYRVTREDGKLADVWYDPYLKLWTVFAVNEQGHQLGAADYATSKAEALDYAEHCATSWGWWPPAADKAGHRSQARGTEVMNNEQVKESITVLDGSDPGFWGLEAGEHVVLLDGCMVHLNADNKVVAVEFMSDDGESHGIVEVSGGVPTFPQS